MYIYVSPWRERLVVVATFLVNFVDVRHRCNELVLVLVLVMAGEGVAVAMAVAVLVLVAVGVMVSICSCNRLRTGKKNSHYYYPKASLHQFRVMRPKGLRRAPT